MAYIDDSVVSRHRSLVLGCLREEDPSIRRRALELLIALVRLNTVEGIVSELLQYLVRCACFLRNRVKLSITKNVEMESPKSLPWFSSSLLSHSGKSICFSNS